VRQIGAELGVSWTTVSHRLPSTHDLGANHVWLGWPGS
jgi:hypothetical protein